MIEYSEILDKRDLCKFPDGAEKAKILALLSAYGTGYQFLDFWVQKREESITAVMMRFDGVITLLCLDDADFEEISLFLPAVTNTVFCAKDTAEKLGLTPETEVFELEFCGERQDIGGNTTTDYNLIYDILSSSDDKDISLGNKQEFYADMCHRTRKGNAVSVLLESSIAVCPYMTASLALISGVTVKKEARGQGFGKKAVLGLVGKITAEKIFVTATGEKAGFYKKCGFEVSDNLSYCIVK